MCGCGIFLKRGQCAHAAFVRWLEGDAEVQLADLREFTRGRGQRTADDVEAIARASARGGRPWKLPRAAAWSTLEDIERKAAEKWAKRKEGESGGGRVHPDALVLLRSEKKQAKGDEQARAVLLSKVGHDLHQTAFRTYFSF